MEKFIKMGDINQYFKYGSLPICWQYPIQNSPKLYKISCTHC